jgi:hypothetical protein
MARSISYTRNPARDITRNPAKTWR